MLHEPIIEIVLLPGDVLAGMPSGNRTIEAFCRKTVVNGTNVKFS